MEQEDLTILLIEDQKADIALFTEILADTSYSTHKLQTAGRMSEALQILDSQKIDIIVLDLHLPDSLGLETFTTITQAYPQVPTIIYTITDDENIALDAIRKGADDYLIKSAGLDTVHVEKSIRKAVETRKNRTAMQQAMRDLERTNEYLEHFAYVASHDLNAPLINLEELHKMLNQEGKPLPNNSHIIAKMEQCVGRLRSTLNSLFRVLEVHQELDVPSKNISLEDMTNKIKQELSDEITTLEANIQFDFSAATEVIFPPEHLHSVMKQLLDNALRYHRKNIAPEIRLRSYPYKKDYICLEVEDNGMGFEAETQGERMFNLFNRPHKTSKGYGIGLYTVKTVVEKHNGFVSAQSKNQGYGSVFQVYFSNTKQTG